VIDQAWSPVLTALAIGLAVASAPGPVQAIVVSEAMRGGVVRGLAVALGAAASFLLLLVLVALGLSVAAPSGGIVRVLQGVGGIVLLWFAVEGYRSAAGRASQSDELAGGRLPAPMRVAIAVLVFPGTWIFTAGVASPLISAARVASGQWVALAVATSLVAGSTLGNVVISVLAGWSGRVASGAIATWIRRALALLLGAIGLAMIATAVLDLGA
jgi:threonine/homoserine/homoserine lactone efflux protein